MRAPTKRMKWLTLCLLVEWLHCAGIAGAQDEVLFRRETRGILLIDEQPVKLWELYRGEKKRHFVLLQLGLRFLLFDTEAREVFELAPETLARQKDRAIWRVPSGFPDSARTVEDSAGASSPPKTRCLPSEDWSLRDVGPTRRIRCKLSKEGRVVEIHLPLTLSERRVY
jgi:hypothetical protein